MKTPKEIIDETEKLLAELADQGSLSATKYFLGKKGYTQQKTYWTKTSSSGGGGGGTLVATATGEPDDDIKALGDKLSQLSLAQWTSLLLYLHLMYELNCKVFF